MSPLPTVSSFLCLFQGERSELCALDTAFALARRFGAILRVLHVSTPQMKLIGPFGGTSRYVLNHVALPVLMTH